MTRTTNLTLAGAICLISALALANPFAASNVEAAELEVVVKDLRPGGDLRVAVHQRVAGTSFPDPSSTVAARIHKAEPGPIVIVFENLAPGEYAVATFHDADRDGELATNFLGMPTEGYGFSNGAVGVFGPPSFDAAAVRIGADDTRVTTVVPIGYMLEAGQ